MPANTTNTSQSQDELPQAVATACREITALLGKLEHAAKKAVQYQTAIGQHIVAIKKARPNDWLRVVEVECHLRRRSAYKYLALVNGTETVEEQRVKNRERVARHRSALRNAQKPPRPPPHDDIGPTSTGEVARRDAEIDELRSAKRLLEIKIAGLESEIADLKRENAVLRQQLAAAQADPTRVTDEWWKQEFNVLAAQAANNFTTKELARLCAIACDLHKAKQAAAVA
jgi:chaperonin cofactor prefoldin